MQVCKLCGQSVPLIKAHIIPKWAIMDLYPKTGSLSKLPLEFAGINVLRKRAPIGTYDKNLFCARCDNGMGVFDGYGKQIFQDTELEFYNEESGIIKSIDFQKLTLFLLCVVYRASVTKSVEFADFSIGLYEAKIAMIIRDSLQGKTDLSLGQYSFVVTRFESGDLPQSALNGQIMLPCCQRIDGVNCVVLYLSRGFKIYLKLDQRPYPPEIEKLAQYKQDGLIVASLGNFDKSKEFDSLLKTIEKK